MNFKKCLTAILALALIITATAFADDSVKLSVPCSYRNCGGTYELYCDGEYVGSGNITSNTIEAPSGCGVYTVVYSNGCGECTYDYYCTVKATAAPTAAPTAQPTAVPTAKPTERPTEKPTAQPTVKPTATPVPTAAPTKAPVAQGSASLAEQIVAEVNAERAKQGLGSVRLDADLSAAACLRGSEISEKFSHTRPDGSSWSTVSNKARGENIAMGYGTVDKVMAAWMSSEGHRANILRSSYTTIGVCAVEIGGVMYWVQLFGTN